MGRFQGIIFDLDGVIRHFGDGHLQAVEVRYEVPRDLVLKACFGGTAFNEALVGRMAAEDWHAVARETLCSMIGRDVGGAVDEFIAFPGWIDQPMLDLVDRLRLRLRVGLLSNGTTTLERHLALHDLVRHFDAVVNTARIGVAKPEARSYLIASERLGVPAGACIFVDDRQSNIEGAVATGFAGIRFTDIASLEADLKLLGVEH